MTLIPLPGIYSADDMRRWLSKFAPDQVVGVSRDACRCPFYEYLRAETGGSVYVGPWEIRIGEIYYEVPEWVQGFKARVDAITTPKTTYFKPITAKLAIELLDAAVKESL